MAQRVAFVALFQVPLGYIPFHFVLCAVNNESTLDAFVGCFLIVSVDLERAMGCWFVFRSSSQCCDLGDFYSPVRILFLSFFDDVIVVGVKVDGFVPYSMDDYPVYRFVFLDAFVGHVPIDCRFTCFRGLFRGLEL